MAQTARDPSRTNWPCWLVYGPGNSRCVTQHGVPDRRICHHGRVVVTLARGSPSLSGILVFVQRRAVVLSQQDVLPLAALLLPRHCRAASKKKLELPRRRRRLPFLVPSVLTLALAVACAHPQWASPWILPGVVPEDQQLPQ